MTEAEIVPGGPDAGLTEHPGLGSYIGDRAAENDASAHVVDTVLAPVRALSDEYPDCWVTKSPVSCIDYIGGTFPNGAVFVEGMCCLPCRLRTALRGSTS